METKYAVLEFTNARYFKKDKRRTKDFIYDINGKRPRGESLFYIEPITVYQIQNILLVLSGERPKPSLREVAFGNDSVSKEIVQYYYQKAMQSYLRINSYKRKITDKKTGREREEFVSEIMQTKKVVADAWSTTDLMTWERVYKFLGSELFNEFKELLSVLFNEKDITEKYSFIQLSDMVLDRNMATIPPVSDGKERLDTKGHYEKLIENKKGTPLDVFFMKLVKQKKTALATYFTGGYSRRREINKATNIKVTINIGTESITKLCGEIIVPVSQEDIVKLSNNKGCATILDGGLVFIKEILTENEVNVSRHTKVSEISTDKY